VIAPLLLAAALAQSGEFPIGTLVEGVATTADPTQTYTLYLPSGYRQDRRWPLLLVFDPRGRARLAAELFRPAAERHGWIVVSSADTRSDGPMEPNLKALRALWAETHSRFANDPRRIYVAGFSGGAHLGWMLAESTRRLAGVIASGGRVIDEVEGGTAMFASFAAAGEVDFNHRGTREADRLLAARGGPHRLEFFSGGHQWMPEPLASHAVAWMELVAMRQALRPTDPELVERLYGEDAAAAAALEQTGDALAAMRRWDAVARTFDGLRDTSEARRRAETLSAGKPVAAALRAEQRCDEFEDERLATVYGELARIAAPGRPPNASRVISVIGVAALHRRADEPGCAGLAARRVLETIATHAGFYVTRDLFAAERWDSAVVALQVAIEAKPDSSPLWYNLACARARSGQPAKALEALKRAVDAGYRDLAHLEADPDLEAIRGEPEYRALVETLRR
jgi:poly(3-hydroxybutyrate) depolymerase